MHDLEERWVTFDYPYNMRCPVCPGITTLTPAEYYSEHDEARVPCARCGSEIHFGPAVMALRDPSDPVLNDQVAAQVAWYHTSTDPGWPSRARPMPPSAAEFLARTMRPGDVGRIRDADENRALHLGTYESAIESMLRHMRDEGEGAAQFYLYSVALRRQQLVIEPGCRDENSEEASQITQSDLGEADVIRYLNVRESPGSISLAVRPQIIGSVRRVSLPFTWQRRARRLCFFARSLIYELRSSGSKPHGPQAWTWLTDCGGIGRSGRVSRSPGHRRHNSTNCSTESASSLKMSIFPAFRTRSGPTSPTHFALGARHKRPRSMRLRTSAGSHP